MICKCCDGEFILRDGCEEGDYCDPCAQKLVPDLVTALLLMVASHGMHGPCRQNNCRDCVASRKRAEKLLEKVAQP
jgi:hypothetical protein